MVDHFLGGDSHRPDGDVYLVTGSHGHIGSYIVEELCKTRNNIQIICVDNLYNGTVDNLKKSMSIAQENNISIVPVLTDITDEALMRETFSKYRPKYVFIVHLILLWILTNIKVVV